MNENLSILFESLRRTDSFTSSADLKASFTLAAGITFLGIYSSIFYNLATNKDVTISTAFLVSTIGIVLVPWVLWFNKIRQIFDPNKTPSSQKSIVSFASITKTHETLDEFINSYKELNEKSEVNNLTKIELDLLENHWICAKICNSKMKHFKASLLYLWSALVISVLGIAIISFYSEAPEIIGYIKSIN